MKSLKKTSKPITASIVRPRSRRWLGGVLLGASLFAAILFLYWPALRGHFIFDDSEFPFCTPLRHAPLSAWIATVGVRPVLIFSYWLNYHLGGVDPFGYHLTNVMIHFIDSGLVFLILLRLLQKAGYRGRRVQAGAAAGALLFAVHPLQTESVSYVAGRSESLAGLFLLLAYLVFLYRREESISWGEAVLVLLLFALGVKTKEDAVSLAPILVLTDLFWTKTFSARGLLRNWRLYGLMVPGAALAVVGVFRMLAHSGTAGFGVATFKWYQYLFTESRAIFTYIRMSVWPVDLSLDHDFATSHTILEHGAILWMLLLAALVTVSVIWRRRYPLFCFGFLMFLLWLAPTSSIVPLDDALVERRMYLALIGLILAGCELGMRVRVSRTSAGAALCLVAMFTGSLCYQRNRLWGDPDKLLELAAANAVNNPRPLLNFTEILIQRNQCGVAPRYLARAERRLPNNYYVNVAWGRTLACLGYFHEAEKRLLAAAVSKPCSQVYEWLGLLYAQMGRSGDAGGSLKKAVRLDPHSGTAHGSLALWYEKNQDYEDAEQEYRMAASIDSDDSWAQDGWTRTRNEVQQIHAGF